MGHVTSNEVNEYFSPLTAFEPDLEQPRQQKEPFPLPLGRTAVVSLLFLANNRAIKIIKIKKASPYLLAVISVTGCIGIVNTDLQNKQLS